MSYDNNVYDNNGHIILTLTSPDTRNARGTNPVIVYERPSDIRREQESLMWKEYDRE